MAISKFPETESFDPGTLLSASYLLPDGVRVRLRLPHGTDVPAILALCKEHGIDLDALDIVRLIRADPHRRLMLCATALLGSSNILVGVASIPLGQQRVGEPDLMVLDQHVSADLGPLLRNALVGRAKAIKRSRAA